MVTVRTFDFGADRTMADAYQGVQSSKLGLRGIRSSLRNLPQMAVQICALMRAAAKGPLRVMFPMVTNIEDWDSAMQVVTTAAASSPSGAWSSSLTSPSASCSAYPPPA